MAALQQLGPDYNPAKVMFGSDGAGSSPYLSLTGSPSAMTTQQPTGSGSLGAEAIRATGSGPFDAAYRQNLATYAGGNFMRPGGNLSFNPTDPNALQGAPTGGGNAPVQGIGTSLVQQAIGGQPFSVQPPSAAAPSVSPSAQWKNNWRRWLNEFNDNGNMFRERMAL